MPERISYSFLYTLVVAAGSGRRMGGMPKQFRLLSGCPLLMHTLAACHAAVPEAQIVVSLADAQHAHWQTLCETHGFAIPHQVVKGGKTRDQSVLNALKALPDKEAALVAIHDGVRPFLKGDLLRKAFETAHKKGNAVPVIALSDTLRELKARGSEAKDRTLYRQVQTPQAFRLDELRSAFEKTKAHSFQDEATRLEKALSRPIQLIEGDPANFKITTQLDWEIAKAVAKERLYKYTPQQP